nr:hypothetical protein [Tanacetum cinerariifolium]
IPRGLKPTEETFQVVLDALVLAPCYPAFVITADDHEVYMHQFWNSVYKHHSFYRFKIDKKKRFKLTLEVFRDIFQICPRIEGQDVDALRSKEDTVSFLRELGRTGLSLHSMMLLSIRCINHGELLLFLSTEAYLERPLLLTNFVFPEHISFRACTIKRMYTTWNYYGKTLFIRLTTVATKSKKRCTTLDSQK